MNGRDPTSGTEAIHFGMLSPFTGTDRRLYSFTARKQTRLNIVMVGSSAVRRSTTANMTVASVRKIGN